MSSYLSCQSLQLVLHIEQFLSCFTVSRPYGQGHLMSQNACWGSISPFHIPAINKEARSTPPFKDPSGNTHHSYLYKIYPI